jgi:hypothetical protein
MTSSFSTPATLLAMRRIRVACVPLFAALAALAADTLPAEPPRVHYEHAGTLSPGAIGRGQLRRGGPLRGFVQPVEIKAPQGALISLAMDGAFDEGDASPRLVGMYIAPVYRLKITNIPLHAGHEVFPTVEIIDRLYAPRGRETRFPIPIDLTQEELEMALSGKFVTRVIYVEDTDTALPVAQDPKEQHWLEVQGSDDVLAEADKLGRPVAILRLGGRLPDAEGPSQEFLFGSPPWLPLAPPEEIVESAANVNALPKR